MIQIHIEPDKLEAAKKAHANAIANYIRLKDNMYQQQLYDNIVKIMPQCSDFETLKQADNWSWLSDFILALQEVEVVVLYARRRGGYKFSFRSEREDVNAGILAHEGLKEWGNGGGHATMAGGFAADEKLNTREEMVYHVVRSHFTKLIQEKWPQIL